MKLHTQLLIDADILLYQAAFSAEVSAQFEGGVYMAQADLDEAKEKFQTLMNLLIARFGPASVIDPTLCLTSPSNNFRNEAWPNYKKPRRDPGKRKAAPLVYTPLREWAMAGYRTVEREGLEADDVMGILATTNVKGWTAPVKVVCSIDKDMLTVPASVYNWRTEKLVHISEEEADYNFMRQTLIGDTVDNYPGCPKVGPVTSKRILDGALEETDGESGEKTTLERLWPAVVEAFEKAGFDEAFALQQARCARILRGSDYDFENKRPILWTPPGGGE